MTRRLESKVCIVTGSGGAIGHASCLRFAEEGAWVVGSDISEEGAQRTLEEVRAAGGTMISVAPYDLTDPAQCKALVDRAVAEYGRVDVLFNNAGKVYFNWIEDLTADEWAKTISQELDIVFSMTKATWPELVKSGGTIVNTASTAGWITFKPLGGLAHSAAKGGVIALTRQLAMEGRAHGIRANSVSPGFVATPSSKRLLQDPALAKPMVEKIMRGTPGRPVEIANVALFLASEESTFVNGADIIADGGTTAW